MFVRTSIGVLLALFLAAPALSKTPHTFRDCRDCPEMVAIPAGQFLMGSPADEPGRDVIEGPRHAVRIAGFAAGKYDVTRGEWRAFAKATHRAAIDGCQWVGPTRDHEATANWDHVDFVQTDRHPVVCVSFPEAQAYLAWLSKRTKHAYRLLSEAEWEYAARGGSEAASAWPAGRSHDFANHGTEECCGGLAAGRDKWVFTSPVGAFPANRFGLYDMSGNVLQFVADCFEPTYDRAPADGSAVTQSVVLATTGALADLNGTQSCNYRVVRGGDWGDRAAWVRPAARSFAPPPGPGESVESYRSGGVGFRVARAMP